MDLDQLPTSEDPHQHPVGANLDTGADQAPRRPSRARHRISHTTVREIWRAFGSNRGARTPSGSPDPDLVEKYRPRRPVHEPADRRGRVRRRREAADPSAQPNRPTLPMLPTTPARATHDYQRNGTCDLFATLEIATGKVITDIRPHHTSADFVAFLNKVNRNVPTGLDVHVILDNLATHKTPTVHKWLLRHRRSTSTSPPPTGRG